jgi:hypothetical protein
MLWLKSNQVYSIVERNAVVEKQSSIQCLDCNAVVKKQSSIQCIDCSAVVEYRL